MSKVQYDHDMVYNLQNYHWLPPTKNYLKLDILFEILSFFLSKFCHGKIHFIYRSHYLLQLQFSGENIFGERNHLWSQAGFDDDRHCTWYNSWSYVSHDHALWFERSEGDWRTVYWRQCSFWICLGRYIHVGSEV